MNVTNNKTNNVRRNENGINTRSKTRRKEVFDSHSYNTNKQKSQTEKIIKTRICTLLFEILGLDIVVLKSTYIVRCVNFVILENKVESHIFYSNLHNKII